MHKHSSYHCPGWRRSSRAPGAGRAGRRCCSSASVQCNPCGTGVHTAADRAAPRLPCHSKWRIGNHRARSGEDPPAASSSGWGSPWFSASLVILYDLLLELYGKYERFYSVIHMTIVFWICEGKQQKYSIFHLSLQSSQSFNFEIYLKSKVRSFFQFYRLIYHTCIFNINFFL